MALNYVVRKKDRLVLSSGSGRVTWSDIKELQDQSKTDPNFDPEFNQLVDLRAVTHIEMSTEQTRVLARRMIFSFTSKRAFIVPNTTVFGVIRMWEIVTELSDNPSQIRVFHDLPSALKWLGLERLPEEVTAVASADPSF
jgi:hypothetical protein